MEMPIKMEDSNTLVQIARILQSRQVSSIKRKQVSP